MRLLITDITRMQYPRVCIAGVVLETGERIRPVLAGTDNWEIASTARAGGAFSYRATFDLPAARWVGRAPEVEDVLTSPGDFAAPGELSREEFRETLRAIARPGIAEAFGETLRPAGKNQRLATREGHGAASLAVVVAPAPFELRIVREHVRATIAEGVDISVTDLRLYHATADAFVVRRRLVAQVNRSLARHFAEGRPVYLALGLTREYEGHHWLQLNAIHLDAYLSWDLA